MNAHTPPPTAPVETIGNTPSAASDKPFNPARAARAFHHVADMEEVLNRIRNMVRMLFIMDLDDKGHGFGRDSGFAHVNLLSRVRGGRAAARGLAKHFLSLFEDKPRGDGVGFVCVGQPAHRIERLSSHCVRAAHEAVCLRVEGFNEAPCDCFGDVRSSSNSSLEAYNPCLAGKRIALLD